MEHLNAVEEKLTYSVIGAFYEAYNTLGFGLSEHLFVMVLEQELLERGHKVAREVGVDVWYKGRVLGHQRIDMIVDDVLVVEAKATPLLHRHASYQLYNYLRATNLEVGLLLHFGPQPQFHRLICRNHKKNHPHHPFHPHHVFKPSAEVLVKASESKGNTT
jgi:GxxExxY protein